MRGETFRSVMNLKQSTDLIRRLVNVVGGGRDGKNVYFSKNRMVVRSYNARRGDESVQSGIGLSDDKIKVAAKFVSGNHVLCEIGARKEVVELDSLWIEKIINMYVEVPDDEEFMWDGSGIEKERGKLVQKG